MAHFSSFSQICVGQKILLSLLYLRWNWPMLGFQLYLHFVDRNLKVLHQSQAHQLLNLRLHTHHDSCFTWLVSYIYETTISLNFHVFHPNWPYLPVAWQLVFMGNHWLRLLFNYSFLWSFHWFIALFCSCRNCLYYVNFGSIQLCFAGKLNLNSDLLGFCHVLIMMDCCFCAACWKEPTVANSNSWDFV